MVARGRRRWRASGCGRWKGYKLFESVEIGLLVMCVRGIEPRTREGDENGEEQRAWFGEKDDGRMTMNCIQAVYI